MSVYVDDMKAVYRGMTMCHMIADTPIELAKMAMRIGVAYRWIQNAGTYKEHFDICLAKRRKAVELGAIELSVVDLAAKVRSRRQEAVK